MATETIPYPGASLELVGRSVIEVRRDDEGLLPLYALACDAGAEAQSFGIVVFVGEDMLTVEVVA